MKYRTTIEIISEANNKNEAMEIVGEYLSGNIYSGVDMRCATKRVHDYKNAAAVSVIILLVVLGVVSVFNVRSSQNFVSAIPGISAIQPPLKTSSEDKKSAEFKKEWQALRDKEALDYIKK